MQQVAIMQHVALPQHVLRVCNRSDLNIGDVRLRLTLDHDPRAHCNLQPTICNISPSLDNLNEL